MSGARLIVIGASAGAVQALLALLPSLPASFPLPMLVVVHVPSDRDNVLVPLLQAKCRLLVKEAEDKEPILGGVIYFAPSDYHLLVEAEGTLALSTDEQVNYSRPSIDVLFESAADAYGAGVVGVVMTGANHDGAAGLKAVLDAGGVAIIQDRTEAYATAMPDAALEACPTAFTMTLDSIASYLSSLGAA
ncbi:chemotaxis protein CheB [Caulobacter segnis]|uniref:protein-glutamate methylesterase n=2 Tax=Caulobacter segnis TaxID=88688 RepID=D5VMC9_CAUST|nr:chemotaxis protein CheB [Caulobacter segnis]ADG11652.1 CheB methylesterase [Caulobacter segnis ATCC 21756]AVQ03300.1 chemotaxis protein CheB [Caulobacter segnis]